MRLFIGLPLSDTYQQQLKDIQEEWRKALRSKTTWTKPGNWHLTLKFLGEVEPERVGDISGALAGVKGTTFVLKGNRAGFFPHLKRPRVVWIDLSSGAEECKQMALEIEQSLVPLGFPPDRRPFVPHLTLARVRREKRDDWKRLKESMDILNWPEIYMDRFVLWKSELTPQGPVYSVVEEFFLQGRE